MRKTLLLIFVASLFQVGCSTTEIKPACTQVPLEVPSILLQKPAELKTIKE